jgi:hypothetical protein
MSLQPAGGLARRHVVSVEDHLYHTAGLLDAIARTAPELLAWTTVCAIDEPGPDTTKAVSGWLEQYSGLQVAARIEPDDLPPDYAPRVRRIDARQLDDLSGFARVVAALLLPGGVLVPDIHLSTLGFVSRDRWWESIYAAATVRGMFPDRPPAVRFLSNKRGYAATFGRDLMDAGFDPRDVMDKAELEATVVPAIARDVGERFPLALELPGNPSSAVNPVSDHETSRRETEAVLDIVEWNVSGKVELGGRLLSAPVAFRAGSHEATTWQMLIGDRFTGGAGVPVLEVGMRLAEAGAERAEASNLAARHIHGLRSRLSNPAAIITANHAYRLDDRLLVGRVRRRR